MELPLNAAKYLTRGQISHDGLAVQALIWPSMVWLSAIPFGAVQFSTSYVDLRKPHIL